MPKDIIKLEQENKKEPLMGKTKNEFNKAFSVLNKMMLKRECFKTLQPIIPNRLVLRRGEPMFCKVNVYQKRTPLHVLLIKGGDF